MLEPSYESCCSTGTAYSLLELLPLRQQQNAIIPTMRTKPKEAKTAATMTSALEICELGVLFTGDFVGEVITGGLETAPVALTLANAAPPTTLRVLVKEPVW